ncbi:hypothetical protein ACIODW_17580 [Streptomyces sp. NPDC087897]|uniref:hypothetical protein n=1 Tax=Streptomyces sp. NPDC087897 TaxID=3365817 RepID=UPI0038133350
MVNEDIEASAYEDDDLTGEGGLPPEQADELADLVGDLGSLMVSVKVETDGPACGAAERVAGRIRSGVGEPDCRVQVAEDGEDAVVGPLRRGTGDPLDALREAMTVLGGTWGEAAAVSPGDDPVYYAYRDTVAGDADGPVDGLVRIHLWAATAWSLAGYVREQAD